MNGHCKNWPMQRMPLCAFGGVRGVCQVLRTTKSEVPPRSPHGTYSQSTGHCWSEPDPTSGSTTYPSTHAGIPPVPSALAIGLSATAGLAAAVAANAMESELARLAEEDSGRRPLSTAVHLVAELERIAVKRGREAPRDVARGALIALWDSVDWYDPGVYSGRQEPILHTLARVQSHIGRTGEGETDRCTRELSGGGSLVRCRDGALD